MVSFRLAAIKILRDSKEPLHPKEITKRALDQNLIETQGITPEATMAAIITREIKYLKDKAAFKKVKEAHFVLNPNFTDEKQRLEEHSEQLDEENDLETKRTDYIGKAGEFLVLSELLFREFNASLISVDEGIDILATKNGRMYYLQVKTSNENVFNRYVTSVRKKSFEKHDYNNTFYIFVLRGEKTNFLIFSYADIKKFVSQKYISVSGKADKKYFSLSIFIKEGIPYVGKQTNDVSYHLNNWDIIK